MDPSEGAVEGGEVGGSASGPVATRLEDLLREAAIPSEENLDQAQAKKHQLNNHRMKGALFAVFCDIKEKTRKLELGSSRKGG